MDETEFREMVKVAVEKMKEETIYQMLQNDSVYNEDSGREGKAEERYMQLDLTAEQKEVCDELLECRDGQNLEYSTAAYLAGLYDAFRITAVLFQEKWQMEEVSKMVSHIKKKNDCT